MHGPCYVYALLNQKDTKCYANSRVDILGLLITMAKMQAVANIEHAAISDRLYEFLCSLLDDIIPDSQPDRIVLPIPVRFERRSS
jgi:hypothetical protein